MSAFAVWGGVWRRSDTLPTEVLSGEADGCERGRENLLLHNTPSLSEEDFYARPLFLGVFAGEAELIQMTSLDSLQLRLVNFVHDLLFRKNARNNES